MAHTYKSYEYKTVTHTKNCYTHKTLTHTKLRVITPINEFQLNNEFMECTVREYDIHTANRERFQMKGMGSGSYVYKCSNITWFGKRMNS